MTEPDDKVIDAHLEQPAATPALERKLPPTDARSALEAQPTVREQRAAQPAIDLAAAKAGKPAAAPDAELQALVKSARATCGCTGCGTKDQQRGRAHTSVLGGGTSGGGCVAGVVLEELFERARRTA